MKQKCEICGRPAMSNRCVWHKQKSISKGKLVPRRHVQKKDKETINVMWEFFLRVWKNRNHVSEVSGEKLDSPPSSLYFHHILLKSKHKEAMYDEENIIILSSMEHQKVHYDMYFYEEINKRRELLKIKYNII